MHTYMYISLDYVGEYQGLIHMTTLNFPWNGARVVRDSAVCAGDCFPLPVSAYTVSSLAIDITANAFCFGISCARRPGSW